MKHRIQCFLGLVAGLVAFPFGPSAGEFDHIAFEAIKRRDVNLLESLLQQGTPPDLHSSSNTTLLTHAALRGDARCVQILLNHGADPNAKNATGVTPLIWGAGDFEKVRLLLAHGADPNAQSDLGNTPLIVAAAYPDSMESLRLLLDNGARVEARNRKEISAAFHCATRGNLEGLKLLIERGADLDYASEIGQTPPMVWSAYMEYDDHSIARLLVDRSVDVNAASARDETALAWAEKRGHANLIALLKTAGAKPSGPPREKKNAPNRTLEITADNEATLIRDSVTRSVSLMLRSSDSFLQNRNFCVSCHSQNLPAAAAAMARDRGLPVNESSLRSIVETEERTHSGVLDNVYQMDRPMPVPERLYGYSLFGRSMMGLPANDRIEAEVGYLASIQYPDGRWDSGFLRPPSEDKNFMGTALVLRALRWFPLAGRESEFESRITRAARWLRNAKPNTHNESAFRLLGLGWVGLKAEQLQNDIDAILALQHSDGGWSQLPDLDSDAWATGLTLMALQSVGVSPREEACRQGRQFLLRSQFDDGSWHVPSRAWPFQPHFDSRFPHGRDQWISIAGTAWATMALSLALEPVRLQLPGVVSVDSEQIRSPGNNEANPKPHTDTTSRPRTIDFVQRIQPIFESSCLNCHGGPKPKGNFLITTRASMLKGGESGETPVVPGKGDDSQLVRYVTDQVEDLEMPPLAKREKYPALTDQEVAAIKTWIDEGAHWPEEIILEP